MAFAATLAAIGIVFLHSSAGGNEQGTGTQNRTDFTPIRSHLLHTSAAAQASPRSKNDAPLSSGALRVRFLKLARLDRYNAIDAALRLNGGDRDLALATLAAAWKTDPRSGFKELAQVIDKMTAYARRLVVFGQVGTAQWGKQPEDLIQSINALSTFPDDPELPILTMRLANRLLVGQKRSAVLDTAALAYVSIDPSLAFSFGSSLSGFEYEQFINTFSKGWAAQDSEAAAQWAASIGEPDLRTSALANAINSFSKSNPDRAAQWLESLPDSVVRQTAIRELGTAWAGNDTSAALAWAGQLQNPSEQEQATAAIRSVAPIGVGISINQPNGSRYPVAAELVPSGPAAQTAGIQRGDQIVAVTNPGSQWVGTEALPLNQVVSLIRGTSGQPVQLRLLPQGATDPSQARTVTIVRQQLLFKRSQPGG